MVGVFAGDRSMIVRDFIGDPSAAGHEDGVCVRTLLAPLRGWFSITRETHGLRRRLHSFAAPRLTRHANRQRNRWIIRTYPSSCREVNAAWAGCRPSRGPRALAATLSDACSAWLGPGRGLRRTGRPCHVHSTRARPCCGHGRLNWAECHRESSEYARRPWWARESPRPWRPALLI